MAVPLTLSSVPAQTPYVQYIATAGQTLFPYPFEITQDSDLGVLLNGVAQPTDGGYTLTGQGLTNGGNVIFTIGLTAGTVVTFYRNITISRITQLSQNGTFFSANFNNEYNRIYLILQQLQQSLPGGNSAFSLMVPNSNNPPATTLLTPAKYANSYLYFDTNGNPQPAVAIATTALTAPLIGSLTGPQTLAEAATSTVVTDTNKPIGNVLRYGLIPNSLAAAGSNSAIFSALVNASIANGPTGVIYFPNTGGAATPDIYYFGTTPLQIRDGITLDLNGCTLNFSGAFNTAMNTFGFLTCIRDVTIQNGTIQVNYNGTGGVDNGAAIRIGSRSGFGFGTFTTGIFDQDNLVANGLPLQGNVTIRNLRIQSNNPAMHIIFATGGLRELNVENVFLDGAGVCLNNGFYYEFGWSSTNGQPGTESAWTSSHMTASHFSNMVISNLATGGASQGFGANGAYGCTASDINIITADQGMGFGAGESFFYRTWALDGTTQRIWNLRDITVKACPLGLLLGGAQPISGYLSAVLNALSTPAKYQAQTDFLNYTLDGFSLSCSGTAIIASGAQVTLRNGACNGGGIGISSECIHSTIENVQINGAAGPNGLRYDYPSPAAIWSPARPVFTAVRNCKITNSTGVGIAVGACQSALIENNQIGANTLYDVAAEATQTNGVNIAVTSFGVRCRNNFISTASSAVAYQNVNNNVGTGNSIENELNLANLGAINGGVCGGGGEWVTDFMSTSAQAIGSAGTIVIANIRNIRLTTAGAVTGVIMPVGYAGAPVYLMNESANSITFAASGTSRVAAGVSAVLAAFSKMVLVWDSTTGLWY